MFHDMGLTEQIDSMLDQRVKLGSGAYLIINRTEALTVIDVNTGKYVGDANLEETVFKTNLLAAKEIAKQLRAPQHRGHNRRGLYRHGERRAQEAGVTASRKS